VPSSVERYEDLFLLADILSQSRFLDALIDRRDLLNNDGKERAQKLKRRLYKVCQYYGGITDLIRPAKRFFPIPHRWVADTFTGTGEGVFNLCDNAHDAVSRGLNQASLSPEIVDRLESSFPDIQSNWAKHQTVHTCIHAELRIIIHLGPPIPSTTPQAIGDRCAQPQFSHQVGDKQIFWQSLRELGDSWLCMLVCHRSAWWEEFS
jgi:hypothetical protein